MTTERKAAKADAADVDLGQAERSADLWLALALRKLARDPNVIVAVYNRSAPQDPQRVRGDTIRVVLRSLADHLEGA